jgi:hypothetical protein
MCTRTCVTCHVSCVTAHVSLLMCTRTCVTCHTSCVTAHVSLLMCTRTSVTCHLRRLMDEGSCAIALVSLHYVNLVGPCCTGMVCEAQVGTHPRPDAFPQKSLQTFATVVTMTPPPPHILSQACISKECLPRSFVLVGPAATDRIGVLITKPAQNARVDLSSLLPVADCCGRFQGGADPS